MRTGATSQPEDAKAQIALGSVQRAQRPLSWHTCLMLVASPPRRVFPAEAISVLEAGPPLRQLPVIRRHRNAVEAPPCPGVDPVGSA